jgi:hypothetical protein
MEEQRGPYKLVGYRFREDKVADFGPDYQDIQFNFSPCFALVEKQFIVSSTIELGRELIDIVAKEGEGKAQPATSRLKAYSSGIAAGLKSGEDGLLTQFMLGSALDPKAAKEQVRLLTELVDRLGVGDLQMQYLPRETRMDIELRFGTRAK